MSFSYYIYRRAGLIVPACSVLFAGMILVASMVHYFMKTNRSLSIFLSTVCPTFVLLAFFVATCFPTIKYSIHLLQETENDFAYASGTIETISPVENSPRYSTEEDVVVRAVFLTIGGKTYYCMTNEGLTQGDSVRLQYLPKSRMVLKWEKLP